MTAPTDMKKPTDRAGELSGLSTLGGDGKALRSYPKVYALGHRAIADLLSGEVVIQEKIDGSQFSFGVLKGELYCRSKGAVIDLSDPQKLFAPSVATVIAAFEAGLLVEGLIYRGEAMVGPRHNTLEYKRCPTGHIVLFDVDIGLEDRYTPFVAHGLKLGMEVTPCLWVGSGDKVTMEMLQEFVAGESFLGGAIEGVVIKNYAAFNHQDGKMLIGKYVTEAFKEQHSSSWGKRNPNNAEFEAELGKRYCTEARWEKAVQHRRDNGELQEAPQDIGPLMKALAIDLREECGDELAQALLDKAFPKIQRAAARGFPQWYKNKLAAKALAQVVA